MSKALDRFLAPITVIAAGVFLFSANLRTDDTGIIAGLIFISAAITSFLFRRPGFLFGSMIGLSIVASELWNLHHGVPRRQMSTTQNFLLLLVVVTVISVAGSALGFAARRVVTKLTGAARNS